MRVLLINPPWPGRGYGTRSQNRIVKRRGDRVLQYPLFLAYAAAQLKAAGHRVVYVDSVMEELTPEATWQRVERIRPDAVFFETTTPSIEVDYRNAVALKERSGGALVMAGGPHVSVFPVRSLQACDGLDVVIKGEFDTRIAGVLAHVGDLAAVPGIAFRRGGRVVDTGPAPLCEGLDGLPFPDRDAVPFQRYHEAWYSRLPFTTVMTSRGCPHRCTFCLWPSAMYGRRQRLRSVGNVVEELVYEVERHGVREVNVDDDTFTLRKGRVVDLSQGLRDRRLDLLWTCNGRVDDVDREMLREMKAAGCKMIRYGVESGSPEILARVRKGITLEQVRRAFRLTREAGIMALGGFMFGFPGETAETVEQTLRLARELDPDMAQFSICMPYPGTPMYEQESAAGRIVARAWHEYDMTHGPLVEMDGLAREELQHVLARAYREFYLRPAFLVRTLRSLHDWDELRRVARSISSLLAMILMHRRRASG